MRDWAYFITVLVLASVLSYARVLGAIDTKVFASNDDSSLFVFWFAHHADVLATWLGFGSGERNFLYTTSMNWPTGVNGAWNTSMLGLALPLAPVTWVFGPLVAYNLAIIFSPMACAVAAAAMLVQFVRRPYAFAGGFAYGFSTYVVAQSAGHLNLAFAILPPLLVLFTARLLRSRGWFWRNALGLGLVVGWQFYLSTELLANTFIAFLVLLGLLCLTQWHLVKVGFKRLLLGGVIALGIALTIGAPLFLTMLNYPGHPRAEIRPHGIWNSDIADIVTPGVFTALGPGHDTIERVYGVDPAEQGAYLGFGWLILCVWVLILGYRHRRYARLIWTAFCAAVVLYVLSMGAPWRFHGQTVAETTPWSVIEQLPFLEHVLPMRLVVHVTLAAATLLALGLALVARTRLAWIKTVTRIGAVLALVSVTSGTLQPREVKVPDFYSSGAYADVIERGSTVKMLPGPVASATPHSNEALLAQALTGMWFKQTGGYFIGATETSDVVYQATPDALDTALGATDEMPSTDVLHEAVSQLRTKGVDYIVVTDAAGGLKHSAADVATALNAANADSVRGNFWQLGGVYIIEL